MLLDDLWTLLETDVFDVPSTDTLFNPYRDGRAPLDGGNAPAQRRANLRNSPACSPARPPLFLLAEAPGPWGCRFSGVPITAENQLADPTFPIDGTPTSLEDEPHTEYSAGIFWRVLQPYFPHFFVWNSVPFHPHDAGDPLSIRTPKRSEVARFEGLLADVLEVLRPRRIGAIGRKAERALADVDAACTYVRHPSQGGAKKFEAGVLQMLDELNVSPTAAP